MASVNIRGVRELVGAFRQVDRTLPKELQQGFKAVARHVVGVAQQKMPWILGIAAGSLKPRATQKSAGIAFPAGGPDSANSKDGYYPWLDFGGTTGRSHSIKRPRVEGGRYLYPAIAESKEYIRNETDKAIEDTARKAGFTTTGHV